MRVTGEIVIEWPIEQVFDFVADERNEPLYNPRMVRAERSPLAPSESAPGSAPRWRVSAERLR